MNEWDSKGKMVVGLRFKEKGKRWRNLCLVGLKSRDWRCFKDINEGRI